MDTVISNRSNLNCCTVWGVFKWGSSHLWCTQGVSGVLKRSVLGPLLFQLYINNLPENIHSQGTCRLFVDDTAITLTVADLQDSRTLQSDLDSFQWWERTWDMFNPSSCQVLHISRSRKPIKPSTSCINQGPVVQSVVSLTSSLRVISLTVLADSIHNILIFFAEKMWVAFALQKLLTFFQQKISAYLRITRLKF